MLPYQDVIVDNCVEMLIFVAMIRYIFWQIKKHNRDKHICSAHNFNLDAIVIMEYIFKNIYDRV